MLGISFKMADVQSNIKRIAESSLQELVEKAEAAS